MLDDLNDWENHFDFLINLYDRMQPNHGLELGVAAGVSLNLFSDIAPDCYWIGVDRWIDPTDKDNYWSVPLYHAKQKLQHKRVVLIRGHFTRVVPMLMPGLFDIVHIDGDHDYNSVARDYNLVLPLLTPNGAIIMHDITHPYCEVHKFWNQIKEREPNTLESLNGQCGLGVVFPKKEFAG